MIRKTVKYLREDYNRRTFIFAGISIIISLAFAVYNGVIGLVYNSVWHASIFTYYVLLMIIKSILVSGEYYSRKNNDKKQYTIIYISYLILILTTIAMIAPAVLLVQNKRVYDWGLIPAITMAAYTTYSITLSAINMNKVKSNDNLLIKQIRTINMITALMSVLVLQNTMIIANGGFTKDTKILCVYVSIAIILSIVIIEVYSFIKTVKDKKNSSELSELD